MEPRLNFPVSVHSAQVHKALPKPWGQGGLQDLESLDFRKVKCCVLQNTACTVGQRPAFGHSQRAAEPEILPFSVINVLPLRVC